MATALEELSRQWEEATSDPRWETLPFEKRQQARRGFLAQVKATAELSEQDYARLEKEFLQKDLPPINVPRGTLEAQTEGGAQTTAPLPLAEIPPAPPAETLRQEARPAPMEKPLKALAKTGDFILTQAIKPFAVADAVVAASLASGIPPGGLSGGEEIKKIPDLESLARTAKGALAQDAQERLEELRKLKQKRQNFVPEQATSAQVGENVMKALQATSLAELGETSLGSLTEAEGKEKVLLDVLGALPVAALTMGASGAGKVAGEELAQVGGKTVSQRVADAVRPVLNAPRKTIVQEVEAFASEGPSLVNTADLGKIRYAEKTAKASQKASDIIAAKAQELAGKKITLLDIAEEIGPSATADDIAEAQSTLISRGVIKRTEDGSFVIQPHPTEAEAVKAVQARGVPIVRKEHLTVPAKPFGDFTGNVRVAPDLPKRTWMEAVQDWAQRQMDFRMLTDRRPQVRPIYDIMAKGEMLLQKARAKLFSDANEMMDVLYAAAKGAGRSRERAVRGMFDAVAKTVAPERFGIDALTALKRLETLPQHIRDAAEKMKSISNEMLDIMVASKRITKEEADALKNTGNYFPLQMKGWVLPYRTAGEKEMRFLTGSFEDLMKESKTLKENGAQFGAMTHPEMIALQKELSGSASRATAQAIRTHLENAYSIAPDEIEAIIKQTGVRMSGEAAIPFLRRRTGSLRALTADPELFFHYIRGMTSAAIKRATAVKSEAVLENLARNQKITPNLFRNVKERVDFYAYGMPEIGAIAKAMGIVRKAFVWNTIGSYNLSSAAVNHTQYWINVPPLIDMKWAIRGMDETRDVFATIATGKPGTSLNHRILDDLGIFLDVPKHYIPDEGVGITGFWNRAMRKAPKAASPMYFFNGTENVNRAATGLGSFYKALETGQASTYDEALKIARETILRTQFDQSAINIFPFMRTEVGKNLLIFKSFFIRETDYLYWLAKNHPEKAAKAGLMMSLAGGSGTLPPVVVLDAALRQAGLRGTQDILEDIATDPNMPPIQRQAARMLQTGLPGLAGVDISKRVGFFNDLDFMGKALEEGKLEDVLGAYGIPARTTRWLLTSVSERRASRAALIRQAQQTGEPVPLSSAIFGVSGQETTKARIDAMRGLLIPLSLVKMIDSYNMVKAEEPEKQILVKHLSSPLFKPTQMEILIKAMGFQSTREASIKRRFFGLYDEMKSLESIRGRIVQDLQVATLNKDAAEYRRVSEVAMKMGLWKNQAEVNQAVNAAMKRLKRTAPERTFSKQRIRQDERLQRLEAEVAEETSKNAVDEP